MSFQTIYSIIVLLFLFLSSIPIFALRRKEVTKDELEQHMAYIQMLGRFTGTNPNPNPNPSGHIRYSKEWKSWKRRFYNKDSTKGDKHVIWTKCAVCDTISATFPRWKRVTYIKASTRYMKALDIYYPVLYADPYNYYWGVCSKECLNMFYLGN